MHQLMRLHKITQQSGSRRFFKGRCQTIGVLSQFPLRANELDGIATRLVLLDKASSYRGPPPSVLWLPEHNPALMLASEPIVRQNPAGPVFYSTITTGPVAGTHHTDGGLLPRRATDKEELVV